MYRTVARAAAAEYEEKRSRFIAEVSPVRNDSEAIEFLAGVRARHRAASHNVYAYIAPAPEWPVTSKRYSDDGEPSGTAGLPVLEVLEKSRLEDVAVVVTRYFGGTLLGAAGLVRSYGKAASLAVASAGVVRLELADEVRILAPYAHYGALRQEIEKAGYASPSPIFGADVEISVQTPKPRTAEFIARVADLTAGAAIAELSGESYITAPADEHLLI
jgi:uncharacterized YigZ family protein